MKTCSKCGIEKDVTEYIKKCGMCKVCRQEHSKAYREANKNKIRTQRKAYREANKDKVRAKKKEYYEASKDAVRARQKAYYESNKDSFRARQKAYREANKDKVGAYQKAYREANKDSLSARQKAYREANKDSIRAYMNAYTAERRASDPMFALALCLRRHANRALAGYGKGTKTEQLLGLPFADFFAIWESRCEHAGIPLSEAVIDHIVPLAAAKTKTEAELLSHWSNLQPLTAEDNLVKSDNMTPALEQRYQELRGVAWLLDALNGG